MAAKAFTPNTDQAVALGSTAKRLLIRAKAGGGKTSLLIAHALRFPDQRLLYVTFGKANKEDAAARFPSNVTTRTSHGLAWEVGGQFKKTGKQDDLHPSQLAKQYKIPMAFARHLYVTLHNFMVSADREILLRTCLQRSLAMTVRRLRNGRSMFGRICSACVSGLVGAAKAKPSEQSFWNPPPCVCRTTAT